MQANQEVFLQGPPTLDQQALTTGNLSGALNILKGEWTESEKKKCLPIATTTQDF